MIDDSYRYFATTVALITTTGTRGPNVMAAEWTMQISYDPMLVAVFVHRSPTYRNLLEKRAFGVNIASDDQAELVNLAGGYSAKELDKLSIPGAFSTCPGTTGIPMVKGCALNAECRVTRIHRVGDHIMVVGRVVGARYDEEKFPLIYTRGNYRRISRSKLPSGRARVRLASQQMAHFEKIASGQFVLKSAMCFTRHGGKVLLQKFGNGWILPFVAVKRGDNYAQVLKRHLASIGIGVKVGKIARLSRMTLTDGNSSVRANFVVFQCRVMSIGDSKDVKWFGRLPKGVALRRHLLQDF